MIECIATYKKYLKWFSLDKIYDVNELVYYKDQSLLYIILKYLKDRQY